MPHKTSLKRIKTTAACLLIFAGTCAAVHAAPPERLSEAEARHLLVRTGYAPKYNEVLALTGGLASDAVQGLRGDSYKFTTQFQAGAFGNGVKAAAQVVASQKGRAGVPVSTLTLGSFDTHQNQLGAHANLLRQLAEGMAALKSSLTELGAWDRTLVMTFSEFGRRARQNNSNGSDHGTVAAHFVSGGAVRGGPYGQPPDLSRLDSTQNALYTTDFRQLYATVAKDWWGVSPDAVTRGQFDPLRFLKA